MDQGAVSRKRLQSLLLGHEKFIVAKWDSSKAKGRSCIYNVATATTPAEEIAASKAVCGSLSVHVAGKRGSRGACSVNINSDNSDNILLCTMQAPCYDNSAIPTRAGLQGVSNTSPARGRPVANTPAVPLPRVRVYR